MQIERKSIVIPGILLGLGLGGFFDGIVLHQILQWHHLLTNAGYPADSVANLELNTFADGIFHAITWTITVVGLYTFWRAVAYQQTSLSSKAFIGALLIGWGMFNLVEGIISHHILGIHHVRSGPDEALWDVGFLIWGVLMVIGGGLLLRSDMKN